MFDWLLNLSYFEKGPYYTLLISIMFLDLGRKMKDALDKGIAWYFIGSHFFGISWFLAMCLSSDSDQEPEMAQMLQSEPQLAAALSGGAFGCLRYQARM